MTTVAIYNAIATSCTTLAAAQSLPLAYPGLNFTPPTGGKWLELRIFWNDNEEYGASFDGPTIERGFFRVNVCDRAGNALNGAQTVAEAVVVHFKKGTQLDSALVERTPSISGPFQEDDKLIVPVTVLWRATR